MEMSSQSDADAADAPRTLCDDLIVGVLAGSDPEVRKTVDPLADSFRASEAEKEAQEYVLDCEQDLPEPLLPKCRPDQTRAVALVNTGKLDGSVEYWLGWDDDSLRALPLDLQQAWAEGPHPWETALQGTGLSSYEPPHDYPVGLRADPTFRDAENSYMKAHLSVEDYAWYLAGGRVGTMRDEAQAAWKKGPSAWAAFLAPPRP